MRSRPSASIASGMTGGEPLLRRDLPVLVERLARASGIADLALTTNGVLLAGAGGRPARRRTPPDHGQPRHAAPERFRGADPVRQSPQRARRHRRRRHAGFTRSSSTRSSSRRQRRRAGADARVRPRASAPSFGSSNTWTSAAPRSGRQRGRLTRGDSRERSRNATDRRRCSAGPPRPPSAFSCRTGRRSGSLRRRRSRSARRATAAA